jgi:glutamine amidotransferase
MKPFVTFSKKDLINADAVILPGVGAFGNAMKSLRELDLIEPLREISESGKILFGICLGLQLLMTESYEFGIHKGLGIIEGTTVRFEQPKNSKGVRLKVPQVGWNRILKRVPENSDSWCDSPLKGIKHGEFMYFVHSYYIQPENDELTLSKSKYGNINFCSSVHSKNVFGCQFHPERSGPAGLNIYRNLKTWIINTK